MTTMLEQSTTAVFTPKGRVVSQLKYALPSLAISFERHWEILKAYVLASKEGTVPVSYKDFGKLTVSPTTISANNKFFESVGLISKFEGTQGKYVPSSAGIAIQRELTWKREANAKARLAELLRRSWFWESAKNIISMKSTATESELIDQLGYDSGADPTKHRSSLAVLVQYLRFSQLITDEGGLLSLAQNQSEPDFVDKKQEKPVGEQEKPDVLPSSVGVANMIMFGVFISPESTEDQIRKAVRTILDEIGRTRRDE
jgi:hypothetical protein